MTPINNKEILILGGGDLIFGETGFHKHACKVLKGNVIHDLDIEVPFVNNHICGFIVNSYYPDRLYFTN